ncbi:hypothetical protein [Opitutus sp. GAS368]|jgi:hypothetical protein|uniref:hypothetical protein n=1 Tax=Opitutus sp. GAS368 TaxID=1882749 RepID=UPI00087A2823|nr:hypothetical protein [Opitutus sp. GAS368]SDS01754.1 hypothetical protein SAMN05444173_1637 [Opitutus sp. GAS368]
MKTVLLFGLLTAFSTRLLADPSVSPSPAPTHWLLGTGFDYSRGDYGFATDTEMFSVPLNLGCDRGPWILRVAIPWITIKGPAAITGTGGAARPTAASESGLGDILTSATYQFGEALGPVKLDFTGRIKFPTADEARGLGTGRTDFYGQFDFYRTYGDLTPFASVGYRVLGNSAVYHLHDGVYASGGTHFRVSSATVLTAAFNWGQRIINGGDSSTDLTLAFTHDLDAQWQLGGYGLKGFTNASPNYGAGLQINRRF